MSEPYCFEPQPRVSIPVSESDQRFPVHRVFCVGRNYHAHAAEMGVTIDKSAAQPFYFNKHPSAIIETGSTLTYPLETANYHFEMELVLALSSGGFCVSPEEASTLVYGYAAGLDMTRRDLQQRAKDAAHPWDLGKDFEQAAVIGAIQRKTEPHLIDSGGIRLSVNGAVRQHATLDLMIWSAAELIADLSRYYVLMPGDLIYTGTPEGVGPVTPGDELKGSVEGVGEVCCTIGSPRG